MNKHFTTLLLSGGLFCATPSFAQLAKDNPNKFLGNITTSYNWQEYCDIDECNLKYTDYWNQVTCENATKWGSVHKDWGKFDWTNADRTYNYCKEHGIIFKYHALIWGSQHPKWIENLSVDETKKAIIEWYNEVQKHYPDLQIIDVVNEAIYSNGNYHSPYKETKIIEALGSLAEDRAQKETGVRPSYNCGTNGYPNTNSYQWLAEAFRLARERWPEAILIYNDYNTFQWQKTEFIALVNGIKACGGPIDAAGNQAHDLNDMSGSQFKSALEDIHEKTQLPQFITEYDINKSNDATFETRYKEQFPIMWEADYVAGVTLWGWIYGKTWVNDGNEKGASGLIRNCQKRSAMTWLEEYMQTDAAKNAQSPFSKGLKAGMMLSSNEVYEGEEVLVSVSASHPDANISKVEFYVDDKKVDEKASAPYEFSFTPDAEGEVALSCMVFASNGDSKELKSTLKVKKDVFFEMVGDHHLLIQTEEMPETGGSYIGGYKDNFEGISYYANGDYTQARFTVDEDGEYTINVMGCSDADVKGSVELYIDEKLVETLSWNSNTPAMKSVKVNLESGQRHSVQLLLVGDRGQSDIFLDFVEIIGENYEEPSCNGCTDVEEVNSYGLTMMPNPASDYVQIAGVDGFLFAEIADLSGRVVMKSSSEIINVCSLAKGIYTVRIVSADGESVKKLIID